VGGDYFTGGRPVRLVRCVGRNGGASKVVGDLTSKVVVDLTSGPTPAGSAGAAGPDLAEKSHPRQHASETFEIGYETRQAMRRLYKTVDRL
jgi:hypothetical protein